MRSFIFRCPVTGLNVQGRQDPIDGAARNVLQFCPACGAVHRVDPLTGPPLPEPRGRSSDRPDWELRIGGSVLVCSVGGQAVLVIDGRRTPLPAHEADMLGVALSGRAELQGLLDRLNGKGESAADDRQAPQPPVEDGPAEALPTEGLPAAAGKAVAIYDRNDRLMTFNRLYLELRSAIGGSVAMGVRWDDLVLDSVRQGHIPEAAGHEDEWLAWRRRQRGRYAVIRRIADGRSFQVDERQSPDGGVAVVWSDITEIVAARQRIESALRQAEDANARLLTEVMTRTVRWNAGSG